MRHVMRHAVFFLTTTLAIAGEYTTYIGDMYPRTVRAMVTDASGNTYVAGNRAAPAVPSAVISVAVINTIGPSNVVYPPNDVFVSKIDPSGKIIFTQTFAGKGLDQGRAVAVDASGNIYVAGSTTSPDFPVTNALQPQAGTQGAGFIVKLSGDGKTILYSTYFGGLKGITTVNAMTTDGSGNLYLTGSTAAVDFPVTKGMPSSAPPSSGDISTGEVGFVAAISGAGDKILFSGTVGDFGEVYCPGLPESGCGNQTSGVAIALDASLNVYFGGNTNSGVATTSGGPVPGVLGAFAGKISANGAGLAYLTYLSSGTEFYEEEYAGASQLSSLAADALGNVYLAGTTGDPQFPVTPGAYQTTFAGNPVNFAGIPQNTDGFIAKLNPTGSAFVWATYLGGNGNDSINSIVVDAAGDAWVAGTTASSNFPNAQGWSQGGDFLVAMNPSGSALGYSARYPNLSVSQAVALDSTTLIHTAGVTGIVSEIASTAAPTPRIFGIQNAAGGLLAGRIAPGEVISIYGPNIGPATASTVTPTGGVYPMSWSGVQVTVDLFPAPLLYVSANQINAVVPFGASSGAQGAVQITNGSVTTPSFLPWVDTQDPAVFPGIRNQNGSLNSETNPAKVGSTVFFYATGWPGGLFYPLTDGQIATQAQNYCGGPVVCQASEGTITYAGAPPGLVAGVTQFNLLLNATGNGEVTVPSLAQVPIFIDGLNLFIFVWVTP